MNCHCYIRSCAFGEGCTRSHDSIGCVSSRERIGFLGGLSIVFASVLFPANGEETLVGDNGGEAGIL